MEDYYMSDITSGSCGEHMLEEEDNATNQTENWTLPKLKKGIIDLTNSDEFRRIKSYYNKKTFFGILELSRDEKSHTKFLHWLFSPQESHGLNDFALKRLLELLVLVKNNQQAQNDKIEFPDGIDDTIICGNYELIIERVEKEKKRGDYGDPDLEFFFDFIIIEHNYDNAEETNAKKKLHIILENKVGSSEIITEKNGIKEYQSERYYDYGKNEVCDRETIYIFLTPMKSYEFDERTEPICKSKAYIGLNYQSLVDYVIEPCFCECESQGAKLFIGEYLRTLGQPSLEFDDTNKIKEEVRIMAIQKDEAELLNNFWEANSPIIEALMSAQAENRSNSMEQREMYSKLADNNRQGQDHTKNDESMKLIRMIFNDLVNNENEKYDLSGSTSLREKRKTNSVKSNEFKNGILEEIEISIQSMWLYFNKSRKVYMAASGKGMFPNNVGIVMRNDSDEEVKVRKSSEAIEVSEFIRDFAKKREELFAAIDNELMTFE